MNTNTSNFYIIEFKKKLAETENKKYLIENEIKKIDSILYNSKNEDEIDIYNWNSPKNDDPFSFFNSTRETLLKSERLKEVFDELQKNSEYIFKEEKFINIEEYTENDYEILKNSNEDKKREIIIIKTFTDYYNWLKELEKEYSTKPNAKNSVLTVKQKLLALHYLGLDMNQTDNVNTAKLLSHILGVGHENIRKALSYVSNGKNEVRSESNLKTISKLFENHSLTEISDKIKKDI